MEKNNPIWALVAVILASFLIVSFAIWYTYTLQTARPSAIEFRVFAWANILSIVFLLLARTRVEWTNRL